MVVTTDLQLSVFYGGDARTGKVVGSDYYVRSRRELTKVSKPYWEFKAGLERCALYIAPMGIFVFISLHIVKVFVDGRSRVTGGVHREEEEDGPGTQLRAGAVLADASQGTIR